MSNARRLALALLALGLVSGCNCGTKVVGDDGGTGGGATGGGATGGGATGGGATGGGATGGGTGGATGGGTGGATGGGTGGSANHAPVLSPIAAVSVNEGSTATVVLAATDADGDTVTFSLTSPPRFVTLSGATITIAPGYTDSGSYTIAVVASDGIAQTPGSFSLTVNNVNRPPVLTQPAAVTMTAGTTQTVVLSATDPDGDPLTYSASGNPTWATLSGSTLSLAPALANTGGFSFTVAASDGTLSDTKSMLVTVNAPAIQPPTVAVLDQVDTGGARVDAGVSVYLTPKLRATVTDPQGSLVRLQAEVVLTSASFSNTATTTGSFAPGGVTDLTLNSLSPGTYKWQVRGENAQNKLSPWAPFNGGNAAFTILASAVTGTVSINGGAAATNASAVTLALSATSAGGTVTQMRFSNDGSTWSALEAYAPTKTWTIATTTPTATVYVEFKDSNGATGQANATILYDATPPTVTSASINGGATAANTSTVTFTVVAADTGGTGVARVCFTGTTVQGSPSCQAVSTNNTYSVTFTGGDGSKIVNVTAVDGAGNTSPATPASIVIDTVAPTISSVSINSGATGTNSAQVSVGVVASDNTGGSGLSGVIFRNQPTAFGTTWGTWTGGPSYAWTLASGDGTAKVGVKVRDAAGNESLEGTSSILLDTTPPTGTFFLNAGAAYTSSRTVTLTMNATDPSGVVAYCAKESTTPPANAADPCWTAMTTTGFTLAAGADGTRTVSLWWKDGVGNFSASPLSASIILDTTKPTVTVSGVGLGLAAGATSTNQLSIAFNNSASDGTGSGLAFVCVSATNPPPQPSSCITYGAAPAVTLVAGDGAKTIYLTVVDAAGNTSAVASGTILLDQTPPSVGSVSINGGAANTNSTAVTVTSVASDPGGPNASGVSKVQLSNDGTTWQTALSYAASLPYTLPATNGTRTVSMRVIDAAGNVSAASSGSIVLDTVAPTGTFSINNGAASTNQTNVTLTLAATDATTSVAAYCAKTTNTAPTNAADPCWTPYPPVGTFAVAAGDGPKTVYVWLKDAAGNFTSASTPLSSSILLDQTIPTVTVSGAGLGLNGGAPATNSLTLTFNNLATDPGGANASNLAKVCVSTTTPPPQPSSCVAYTATPSVTITSPDGTKTVYITVTDNAGNTSAVSSASIIYDATPPSVSAVLINGGAAYTNTPAVSITSTATDATSGVSTMQFSEDNGLTWSPLVPNASPKSYTLLAGADGTRTVSVRVKDAAGNYSVAPYPNSAILLDTTPPTCTISAIPPYTTTSPISVSTTYGETGSGVSQICLKEQDAAIPAPVTPSVGDPCFAVYASPKSLALAAQGKRTVYCYLLDKAGNVTLSPGTGQTTYDTQAPAVPAAPTVTGGDHTLTISWTNVADVGAAGVQGYYVQYGTVASGGFGHQTALIAPGGAGTTSVVLPLSNGTTFQVRVIAIDNAGNTSAPSASSTGAPRWPWAQLHRTPVSSDFTSSTTINTGSVDRYLAVGLDGALVYTDNLGTTWTRGDAVTDAYLRSIFAANGKLWVSGDNGYLAVSTDFGASFYAITNSEPNDSTLVPPRQHHLNQLVYTNGPSTAYTYVAVGEKGTVLFGTQNVGVNGNIPTVFSPKVSGTTNTLRSAALCPNSTVACASAQAVVAVGDTGTIIRSTDSGQTWATIPAPTGYSTANFRRVVWQPSTDTFYATVDASTTSLIVRSTDGGQTWAAYVTTPALTTSVGLVDLPALAISTNTLWVGGRDTPANPYSRIFRVTLATGVRTAGSGDTFSFSPAFGAVTSLTARTDTEAMAFGTTGQTWVQATATTWTDTSGNPNTNSSFRAITMMPGGSVGIAAGNAYGLNGAAYVTYISGLATYTPQTVSTTKAVTGVGMVSAAVATIVGAGGLLVETHDNGTTWTVDPAPFSTVSFNGVACLSGATGARACLTVGGSQTVGQFNGTTHVWTSEPTGLAGLNTLNAVDFYTAAGTTRAVIGGAAGTIATWDSVNLWKLRTPLTFDPLAIHAQRTDGVLIAVGASGSIARSADNGVTWTKLTGIPTGVTLRAVTSADGAAWFVAGDAGTVLRSTDNGLTWSLVVSNTSDDLYGLAFTYVFSANVVYAAGANQCSIVSATLGI